VKYSNAKQLAKIIANWVTNFSIAISLSFFASGLVESSSNHNVLQITSRQCFFSQFWLKNTKKTKNMWTHASIFLKVSPKPDHQVRIRIDSSTNGSWIDFSRSVMDQTQVKSNLFAKIAKHNVIRVDASYLKFSLFSFSLPLNLTTPPAIIAVGPIRNETQPALAVIYNTMQLSQVAWGNGQGLFMQFCDPNHEITQMQQEEKGQHHRAEINCMLMMIWRHQKVQV